MKDYENYKEENNKSDQIAAKIKDLTGIQPLVNGCCLWVGEFSVDIDYYCFAGGRLNYLAAFEKMLKKLTP